MSLLYTFECAARHATFTAAATELSLTQSAVSRQIGSLEEILGSELFHREKQTVRLSLAGETYAREVRESLNRISNATLGYRANPGGGSLNLAILPTFGTRWLAPRLPEFLASNPGITINLETRLAPFDLSFDTVDAAIHFGMPYWSGAELAFLMQDTLIPTCSPTMLAKFAFKSAADLATAPLLHLSSRPNAWEQWFAANEVEAGEVHGMLVDQFATAAQAASSGLGIALLPEFLARPEINRGDLVMAIDRPMRSEGSYYLAWSPSRATYPPLQAFRNWIVRKVSEETSPASD